MANRIEFSLGTFEDNTPWEYGKRMFEIMSEEDKAFLPKTVGYNESKMDITDIDSIESSWARKIIITNPLDPSMKKTSHRIFMWNQDFIRADEKHEFPFGGTNFTGKTFYGNDINGFTHFTWVYNPRIHWEYLFVKLCAHMKPFWAFIHLEAEEEVYITPDGHRSHPYYGGVTHFASRYHQIGNLGCLNFIRDDWADPAIWPKIEAAGFPVERYLDGHLLRVTPGFTDLLEDFPHFSRRRAELKQFFPPDLFEVKDEPPLPDKTASDHAPEKS